MTTPRSAALFAAAERILPGGVNSPVRAFRGVGGTPRFIARGDGPYLHDEDGQRYIDHVLSWGALILGHAHPAVVAALTAQLARGTSFGAPTALETELAERIAAAMPSIEMIRFVSSGTEAVMSAIRLARAATGRRAIIKFSGCYHGHADALLVQAGSGIATLGLPDSPGVTAAATGDTLVATFNDLASVEACAATRRDDLAAILVEPIAGNMGMVLPAPGFLAGLRAMADRTGALLIFDEVMTGFRVAPGGAQALYNVTPDLTCLGKVIGGGLPAAAYGGRRDLMQRVAPAGTMYQAGTLSGNPLAMQAGITTLTELLGTPETFAQLAAASAMLAEAMRTAGRAAGVPIQAVHAGGMWGFFFAASPVTNYENARTADTGRYARFFHAALERGVYCAPSPFEAAFVSTAHTPVVIAASAAALAEAVTVAATTAPSASG